MKISPTLLAGVYGIAGVGLGAFGAHALKPALLERGMLHAWETAVLYHLVHTVALVAAAGWRDAEQKPLAFLNAITWCWGLGMLLFSGSLYVLALGGPRWLGPITPLGGVGFLLGWLLLALSALRASRTR